MAFKRRNIGKKGVSPLIATVLLIAFAVALGAVVMNWGRSFVQNQMDQTDKTANTKTTCAMNAQLHLYSGGTTSQHLCFGGSADQGYVEVMLSNDAEDSTTIKGISAVIIGDKPYNNDSINVSMGPGAVEFLNITYSYSQYGMIKSVRFVPKILVGQTIVPCTGSPLEKSISDMINCSS